jgi:hypothetical protein
MGNSGSSLLGCMHLQLLEKACNTCNGLLHFSIFPGFVSTFFAKQPQRGLAAKDAGSPIQQWILWHILGVPSCVSARWITPNDIAKGRWFDEKAVFTCVYYQHKQIVQCWVWLWKVFGALLLYIGRLIGNEAASCRSLCHDRSVTCPGCFAARHWPTLYTSHWNGAYVALHNNNLRVLVVLHIDQCGSIQLQRAAPIGSSSCITLD